MYYRAFFGTITMLGLAALIGMFAILSSPLSPPSPAYAQEPSNKPPVFSDGNNTREVAENTAARQNIGNPITATDDDDKLAYTLNGTDADSFTIVEASGQLRTKALLNYEAKPSYSVTVWVGDKKDDNGNPDTATDVGIDVTINVTNVEEPGTVTLSSPQPQVGTNLTAALTDPDGEITGVDWKWESSSNRSSWTIISTATSATVTPSTSDVRNYLRATASYTDKQGSGKTAEAVSVKQVKEAPADNIKPHFTKDTDTRSVAEKTAPEVNIGLPVTATDSGDILTYTLGGTDAELFDIVRSSGQLQTKAALDHETKDSYSVTVSVSDNKDPSGDADTATDDTIDVTITVTNVEEPGTVTLSPGQPQEGTGLTATLNDPDGYTTGLTWQWARTDSENGFFTDINAAGSATFTPGTSDVGKYLEGHGVLQRRGESQQNRYEGIWTASVKAGAGRSTAPRRSPKEMLLPGPWPRTWRLPTSTPRSRPPTPDSDDRADLRPERNRCRLLRHRRSHRPVARPRPHWTMKPSPATP